MERGLKNGRTMASLAGRPFGDSLRQELLAFVRPSFDYRRPWPRYE